MPPLPPVTQALLLVNVAVFFLAAACSAAASSGLFALWPLGTATSCRGRSSPTRSCTAASTHLFFNMLGLWMFGSELERLWGQKRYLQFYAASVLTPRRWRSWSSRR